MGKLLPIGVLTTTVLSLLLLIALTLRLGTALMLPSIHHPDEVFQTVEQGYRLWSGQGVIPWEWRLGTRSWMYPGLLGGIITLAGSAGAGPGLYLGLISTLLALASLAVVVVGFLIGCRFFGLSGGLICGGLCAVWHQLVYFAPKTLSEPPAAHLLVAAVYLATVLAPNQEKPGSLGPDRLRQRMATIGLLLGLIFSIRFHLAPALLVVAVWVCRARVRTGWLPLVLGGLFPVAALGVLDWLTWGTPFQSVWKNIWVNVVEGRSLRYGTAPSWWYFAELPREWGLATAPLLATALIGVRRVPLFGIVAVVVVLSHVPLAHKETRFLFPAVSLLVVTAGLGTAEIAHRLALRLGPASRPGVIVAAMIAWCVLSLASTTGEGFRGQWTRSADLLRASAWVRTREDLCGLGIYGIGWWETGGYSHLHRRVPIQLPADERELAEVLPEANYLFVPATETGKVQDYETLACWSATCVLGRGGICTNEGKFAVNEVLRTRGD